MDRRGFIVAVGGISTFSLAGCLGDDGQEDDVEDVVQLYFDAMDDGEHEVLNQMIADGGDMGRFTAADGARLEQLEVEVTHYELLEIEEDRSEVEVTVQMTNGEFSEDTIIYELRKIDGEWLFWSSS